MHRVAAFLLLLTALLWAPQPAAAAEGIAVTGTLVDEAGRALEGAEVALHRLVSQAERGALLFGGRGHGAAETSAATGAEGRFRLEVPEAGFWTVVARAEGRVPLEYRLWPLLAAAELAPAEMLPDAGLRVRVVDEEGRPIAGAVVEAEGPGPADRASYRRSGAWRLPAHRVAACDAQGRARLPRFEGERVVLRAAAPGRSARQEVGEPPAAGPARVVRLVLPPGPTRRLEVLTPDGRPAPGAVVWSASRLPAGVTGEDGTVEVPLPAGGPAESVTVRIGSPDALVGRAELRALREGEEDLPVRVRLAPPPAASGRVLEAATGDGVAGALVWPYRDPASAVRADRTGSFRVAVVGAWHEELLGAAAPGLLRGLAQLPGREAGSAAEVVLELEPAASLEGWVQDTAGAPLGGAEVRVMRRTGWQREWPGGGTYTRTGGDGRFRVDGLAPGEVHLVHAGLEGYAPALEEVAPAPEDARAGQAGRPGLLPSVRLVLQPHRGLRGRVVDGAGSPVAAARVVIASERELGGTWSGTGLGVVQGETRADGGFELDALLPGPASLVVSAAGYAPLHRRGVELGPGEGVADLGELVLAPAAWLEGRVVDPEGRAIAEATVGASRETEAMGAAAFGLRRETRSEPATTAADGTFRLGGLIEGERFRIEVTKKGYAPAWASGVRPPVREPLVVVLQPAGAVTGTVVDERGRPLPEAEVRASWRSRRTMSSFFAPVRTGGRGEFELTGIAPGVVALEAAAAGFQVSAPVSLELAAGERRAGVRIVLREGVAVSGRVLDPEGRPLAGALVSARGGDGSGFSGFSLPVALQRTGADGRFTLDSLAPGRVVLEASKEGYAEAAEALELGPGGATVELRLGRGAEVSGWVVEADGSPGGGRELQLVPGSSFGGTVETVTSSDGTFAFRAVADGEYRLSQTRNREPVWSAPEPVRVEGGAPVTGIELRLPAATTLTGRVVGLEPGEVPGATVQALLGGPGLGANAPGTVLDDGSYRVSGLTPGRWMVIATAGGSGREAHGWVEIEDGQAEAALDLELPADYHTVTGTVLANGRPASGIEVSISGGLVAAGGRATTGLDGRFRLDGVPAGHRGLSVTDPGSGASSVRVIEVAGDLDVRVELDSHRVRGTVYAADGSGPVAGAVVQLLPLEARDGWTVVAPGVTGADGSFLLTGVAAGRVRLRVERSGYADHGSDLEVVGWEVEAEPVYLERPARLEIVARLASGEPPASVMAASFGPGDGLVGFHEARPVAPGRFVLDTVAAGSWELQLVAPGAPAVRVRVEAPGVADVVFPEPCTLVVSVPELEADGTGAHVVVTDSTGRTPWLGAALAPEQLAVTGGRGELRDLAPGAWTVTVIAADGRTWTGSATLAPGAPVRLVLE